MEIPNAFAGKTAQPTPSEVEAVLGESALLWRTLIDRLADEDDITEREWKSVSPKYGWSLRLKANHRTILYLGPCEGCFRTSLVLGNRAVHAALHSGLPQGLTQAIQAAPHFTEGTGVAVFVKRASDLTAVHKLIELKLAN